MNHYLVQYGSKYVWHDDQHFKATRIEHVVKSVKLNLDFMVKHYLDSDEFKKDFKRVYKRFNKLTIYEDKESDNTVLIDKGIKDKRYKPIGKFIEVQGKAKDIDYDNSVICAYIYRLTNKDLAEMKSNEFQQVDVEGYTP